MRTRLLLTTMAVILFAGCGTSNGATSGTETPTPDPQPGPQRGPQPGPQPQPDPQPDPRRAPPPAAELPSQTACHLDTDCTVAISAPDGDNLCCDRTVTAQPIASAYLQSVAQWRTTACAGVTCPPGMLPGAQLAPCGYEPRCVASACTNACGQPPRPQPPSIHSPPS